MVADLVEPARLRQRRDCRRLRRDRRIERRAHPVQHIHNSRRRVAPADAQPSQAEDLAEGARHHRVVRRVHQPRARLVIRPRHVFGIGGVQHQQHFVRQPGPQPLHRGSRQHRPGRVVRVGEEHEAGGRRDRRQHRVHVRRQVALRRLHHLRPGVDASDFVDRKPMLGHHQIPARAAIGQAELVDQVVRSGAADDPRRIEPEPGADRAPQVRCTAIRIAVQPILDAGDGRLRAGRHAERTLVGRQLDHPVDAGNARRATDIRRYRQDLGARPRPAHATPPSVGTG